MRLSVILALASGAESHRGVSFQVVLCYISGPILPYLTANVQYLESLVLPIAPFWFDSERLAPASLKTF